MCAQYYIPSPVSRLPGSLLDPHIVLQLPQKDATNDNIIITRYNSFSLTMIFPFLTTTEFSLPLPPAPNSSRDLCSLTVHNSLGNSHLDSSVNYAIELRHKACLRTKMSLTELSEIWLRNIVHAKHFHDRIFKIRTNLFSVKVVIAYKEIHTDGYFDFVGNDKIKTNFKMAYCAV